MSSISNNSRQNTGAGFRDAAETVANGQSADFSKHGTYLTAPKKGRKNKGKRNTRSKVDARVPDPAATHPDPLKALNELQKRAEAKSVRHCARYVDNALALGGYRVESANAHRYGKNLEKAGWVKVAEYDGEKGFRSFLPGEFQVNPLDIGIVQPTGKRHKFGHAAAYSMNGQWISDYVQKNRPGPDLNGLYPAQPYRDKKIHFDVYRDPKTARLLAAQLLAEASRLDPANPEAAKLQAMAQRLDKTAHNEALAGNDRQTTQPGAPRTDGPPTAQNIAKASVKTAMRERIVYIKDPAMVTALAPTQEKLTTSALILNTLPLPERLHSLTAATTAQPATQPAHAAVRPRRVSDADTQK